MDHENTEDNRSVFVSFAYENFKYIFYDLDSNYNPSDLLYPRLDGSRPYRQEIKRTA